MTTLTVNLSQELQQELGQKDVYAYAAYFTNSGTTLAPVATLADGSGHVSASTVIDLPPSYPGGKVYFIIQSGQPSPLFGAGGVITQESDISFSGGPTAADALNYRFDSFELSLLGSASDVGNLTEVNGCGLDRMAASPAEALGNHISGGYSSSDWDNYISSLHSGGATSAGDPHQVQIVGYYNGGKDADGVYHNGGFYSYGLTYVSATDSFVLIPDATSQIQGTITITAANLANSIYATNGSATISGMVDAQGQPTTLVMNTGWNNAWGAVLRDLSTGFTAGYYDGTGSSLNTSVTSPIDLNKTWN